MLYCTNNNETCCNVDVFPLTYIQHCLFLYCINSNEICCNLFVPLFTYVSQLTATFKHQCTIPSQASNLFLISIFVIPLWLEEHCNAKGSNEHGWHLALTRSYPNCMTHWSFLFNTRIVLKFVCEFNVLLTNMSMFCLYPSKLNWWNMTSNWKSSSSIMLVFVSKVHFTEFWNVISSLLSTSTVSVGCDSRSASE